VANPQGFNPNFPQSLRAPKQSRPNSRATLRGFPEQYPPLTFLPDKFHGNFLLFYLEHHLDSPLQCVGETHQEGFIDPAGANAVLGRAGRPFWQDESYDHWVRNAAEFESIRQYIEYNPVMAGLVERPDDWMWSSAAKVKSGTGKSACATK